MHDCRNSIRSLLVLLEQLIFTFVDDEKYSRFVGGEFVIRKNFLQAFQMKGLLPIGPFIDGHNDGVGISQLLSKKVGIELSSGTIKLITGKVNETSRTILRTLKREIDRSTAHGGLAVSILQGILVCDPGGNFLFACKRLRC